MSEDYLSLVPSDTEHVPDEEQRNAAFALLEEAGIVRREGDGFMTGPGLAALVEDPKPVLIDGTSALESPAAVTMHIYPFKKGHAGMNLQPIACIHCNSELPFDEALAAFEGAKDGDRDLSHEERHLVCFHCEKENDVFTQEFDVSGAFARFDLRFAVSTSRQTGVNGEFLARLGAALGCELHMVQILQ